MKDIIPTLERLRARGERVALATVIKVDGSAPRDAGATMLIGAGGEVVGSVSGGCVEGAVVDEARSVLAGSAPKIVRYGINRNMMWDVGLSCGGAIDVYVQTVAPDAPLPDLARTSAVCMVVRGPRRVGQMRIVYEHASEGSTGDAALDARIDGLARGLMLSEAQIATANEHDIFVMPLRPDPRLIIVGAVHIGAALCEAASRAGFSVTVLDPRPRLNTRERFPGAARLIVGWPEDELPALHVDEDTYVVVLTHDEKFDDPTLAIVLRRPVRYIGAIGSRKTQALRRKRLEDAGFSADAIDSVHAPIGLDIGAQSPEEIAIAILAEMIAAKYHRSGEKLKDRRAPHIHA